jgi:hypothetical protein
MILDWKVNAPFVSIDPIVLKDSALLIYDTFVKYVKAIEESILKLPDVIDKVE